MRGNIPWNNEKNNFGKVWELSLVVKWEQSGAGYRNISSLVWSASVFLILKNALTGTTFQSQRKSLTGREGGARRHTHTHTWTNKTDLSRSVVSLDIPGCLSLTLPAPSATTRSTGQGRRRDLALLLFFHRVFNNPFNGNCRVWRAPVCCAESRVVI